MYKPKMAARGGSNYPKKIQKNIFYAHLSRTHHHSTATGLQLSKFRNYKNRSETLMSQKVINFLGMPLVQLVEVLVMSAGH